MILSFRLVCCYRNINAFDMQNRKMFQKHFKSIYPLKRYNFLAFMNHMLIDWLSLIKESTATMQMVMATPIEVVISRHLGGSPGTPSCWSRWSCWSWPPDWLCSTWNSIDPSPSCPVIKPSILATTTTTKRVSEWHLYNPYSQFTNSTVPNLGNGHLVVDREQWGASKNSHGLTIPLKRPIPYVLITHIGVQSLPCDNIYKCSIKMRTIQDSAIAEKGLPDIQSNFYVSLFLFCTLLRASMGNIVPKISLV